MAEGEVDERQSFGNLARSLKKYGSTCNHVKKPPDSHNFCRHEVEEGDTLQGLALKYGVTMEQIRRVNRLWSSDSLFVRETLLIPAPPQGAPGSSSTLSPGGFSADSGHSSDSGDEPAILRERPQPVPASRGAVARDQSDSSLSDFLGKIDSSIARTKHQVAKHRGSSEFWNGVDADEFSSSRRKPAVSRLRQTASSLNPDVQTTQPGRRLRSSLQRLEAAQDELFEL